LNRWLLSFLLALSAASSGDETVGALESRGFEIAAEARRVDVGFADSTAALQMVLQNAQGETSVRRLRAQTLESTDGEKRMMHFDEPVDVKGTVMLTYTHKRAADDQWLYLPALKRVKRIASSNKAGPFMGSEFAYEDLGSQEVEKYRYKYLRDEPCAGGECFVIERYPVETESGYRRQVLWLDKVEYRPWRLEYYDRRDALLKTLAFAQYERYLSKYWRAGEMTMVNAQSGKSTVLRWSDYRFRVGLKDGNFLPQHLPDAR